MMTDSYGFINKCVYKHFQTHSAWSNLRRCGEWFSSHLAFQQTVLVYEGRTHCKASSKLFLHAQDHSPECKAFWKRVWTQVEIFMPPSFPWELQKTTEKPQEHITCRRKSATADILPSPKSRVSSYSLCYPKIDMKAAKPAFASWGI